MKLDQKSIYLQKTPHLLKHGLTLGIIGLVLSIVGAVIERDQFYFSFLVAGLFWMSILLGALFYTMVHHLVGARWSIVVRRVSETMANAIPYVGIAFLIILFLGLESLYHWTHNNPVDHLLAHKRPYLNVPFFMVRAVLFIGIWSFLGHYLYKHSIAGDQKYEVSDNSKLYKISAPGLIVFAMAITFAAFDWIMTLDHHWYSTIFGVYFFAGCAMSFFAFMILVFRSLQNSGHLKNIVTVEHFHDLGKLMFAFTCFWTFTAFSQYMLIWYGNIPEETVWYSHRWVGTWKNWSLFLAIGHFPIPFVLLMSRLAKRNIKFLVIMAIWLLGMQWVDLYWLVMPNFHHHGIHISWIDFAAWIMVSGFTIHFITRKLKKNALVPIKDPFLQNSIEFMNH
ncbi:MAG: hypothetical protein KDK51_08085 [Deltaproteobacteria bacterium]|nr:hypothetical protein [Deltaproteobacteria bacterium]